MLHSYLISCVVNGDSSVKIVRLPVLEGQRFAFCFTQTAVNLMCFVNCDCVSDFTEALLRPPRRHLLNKLVLSFFPQSKSNLGHGSFLKRSPNRICRNNAGHIDCVQCVLFERVNHRFLFN